MTTNGLRVGWYRFRVTFRRRWGGYLAIVLLVGLVGGIALGSIAAGRRTQSSFPAFVASVNPPALSGVSSVLNPETGSPGYNAKLVDTIAHLPHVTRVASFAGLDILPLGPDGAPGTIETAAPGNGNASVDGLYFDMERVTVTQGRMADPARADEFVATAAAAQLLGWHVGDVVPMGVYTNDQSALPDFGKASVPPHLRVDLELVGIVVSPEAVVADDVDAGVSTYLQIFTPALTKPLLDCCVNYTGTGVQVDDRSNLAAVQTAINQTLSTGFPPFEDAVSPIEAKAQRAIRPEAVALDVFGAIAALVAILIAAQMIGRQLRLGSDEVNVLRALGAGPAATSTDGLIGIFGALVIGSLLAMSVAVALSPLAPIGPVRAVDPTRGVAFDWTVLGVGAAVLIVGLGAVSTALAFRGAPHSVAARTHKTTQRGSTVARTAAASGFPVPAVTGIRFALEPGAGRTAVPVRSAILGATLAVIVVTGSLTFSACLDRLVSHPALYGWNWDYELSAGSDSSNMPEQQAADLLDHDADLAAWTPAYFTTVHIDGQSVPVLAEAPNSAIGPPTLSGSGLEGADQVVIGDLTLAQLHKHIGDTVDMDNGITPPTRLRIVGTATMPTMGSGGTEHLQMGTGALFADELLPDSIKNSFNNPVPGPNGIFVRLRDGVDRTKALASLQQIATMLTNPSNFGVAATPVERPAEIVNYRSMGSTPAFLGAGLAVGAVFALALTLTASVRRRRRDLALLKTLGFTRRQLAAAVSWQSTVAVTIGTVVGVPLGVAAGRSLWTLFARGINAVPQPTVPTASIALVTVGALVLANIVAAVPGRRAARTPTALLLRTE
ncbi:MAG: putative transport system permease protein [Acidimicrobiaceae bacterium]